MTTDDPIAAYRRRADEYIDALGTMAATAEIDRDLIGAWTDDVDGRILDVGCGPGHWTAWLHDRGCDVEGVDPAAEFIERATQTYPGVSFRLGRADRLDVPDSSLAGVLAWYSLIHLAPPGLEAALAELARALRPDGRLVVGFFEGPELTTFAHAMATAYFWPVDELARRVEVAGFSVEQQHARTDPGARRHGAIVAVRRRATPCLTPAGTEPSSGTRTGRAPRARPR